MLQVDHVTFAYDEIPVLEDINLKIHRGEHISVIGESGCGKSTLLKIIYGLLHIKTGEVYWDDNQVLGPLHNLVPGEPYMKFLSQDFDLMPYTTVFENVSQYLSVFEPEELKRRTQELLEMIELDESFIDRLPGEMSGGQKQRICIARALAAEPELIICDEVTSALDQIVQEGILKLLLKLQKDLGVSYIFITHDIATVQAISDEIVVMFQGKVVEQGLKTKIMEPPYPDYTQLLLSSVPEMDPDWLSNLLKDGTFINNA